MLSDTFVIGTGLMIGRVLGFVREMLLAKAFGVSAQMDALVVALSITDVLAGVFLGSAAAAVIIPPLAKLYSQGKEQEFWQLSLNMTNLAGCCLLLLSLAGMVFAKALVLAVAPGLGPFPFTLAVNLTRIGMASLLFTGLGFVLTPILQARQRFLIPSLTTALHNAVTILFILFLVSRWGAAAVAWSVVCGSALRMCLLYMNARREGMRWRRRVEWRHPETLQIVWLMAPAVLSFSLLDMNLLIDRNFASRLPSGSIAALNYADKLIQVPLVVIAGALSLAVLPAFSVLARNEDWIRLRRRLLLAIGWAAIFLVPATLSMMVLRLSLIDWVYRRGAFDHSALAMTAAALFWYAAGLPFQGINLILVRVFHARLDLRTPLVVGVLVLVSHIGLNILCVHYWSYIGIAVSNATTALLHTLLLVAGLQWRTPLRMFSRSVD